MTTMVKRTPPEARIRTARLVLRPLAMSDAQTIVAALSDIEVTRWLSRVPYPYGLDEAKRFLAWRERREAAGEDLVYGIDFHGLVGLISLTDLGASPVLGYWLVRSHWGRGIMSEAVGAVLGRTFEDPAVERIRSGVFEGNERSLAVQRRFGFEIVGRSMVHNLALSRDLAHIDTILTRARHRALTQRETEQ